MVRFAMLVPQKGVGELRRMLDEVRGEAKANKDEGPPQIGVAVHGGSAFFVHGALLLSVKLAEAQFPPYAKVIPQNQDKRVVIARTGLVEALRRQHPVILPL